jgi:hypothetical protein
MIPRVDETLRTLFAKHVALLAAGGPVTDDQIGFAPPDAQWRGHVHGLGTDRALNVFLVDLRDNRRLRSSERVASVNNGDVVVARAPARVDCHYLISAWSNETDGEGNTADQHELLHEVLTALVNAQPLVPSAVFAPASVPTGFPDVLADAELPTVIAPEDGFPKLAEFWGTMGERIAWRPAVWLVVTVPVLYDTHVAGPMVTTTLSAYRPGAEELINLGGQVLAGTDPVPGAAVRLLAEPGGVRVQATTADDDGRFRFTGVRAGPYRLRAGAQGLGSDDRPIDVPSTTGEYDLHLA